MARQPNVLALLTGALLGLSQFADASVDLARKEMGGSSHGGGHGRDHGGHGGHHDSDHHHQERVNNTNYYDSWSSWDFYDSNQPNVYQGPDLEPRRYEPANPYQRLYPNEEYLPSAPPEIGGFALPIFDLSTATPMVYEGEEIRVEAKIKSGVPPYVVFWQTEGEGEWMAGDAGFTKQAKEPGIITIRAIVKDALGAISQAQKIQVVVLKQTQKP